MQEICLSEFNIKGFRRFSEFKVHFPSSFSLVTGDNNSGKTTLLESIFLFFGAHKADLLMTVQSNRQMPFNSDFDDLFTLSGRDSGRMGPGATSGESTDVMTANDPIELVGCVFAENRINKLRVTLEVRRDGALLRKHDASGNPIFHSVDSFIEIKRTSDNDIKSFDSNSKMMWHNGGITTESQASRKMPFATYLGVRMNLADTDRISAVLRDSESKRIFVEILRKIDKRINDVQILTLGGAPIVHLGVSGHSFPMPLAAFGTGVGRIADVVSSILGPKSAILLIDEIENGIHYSHYYDIAYSLISLAKQRNTQVIATTHSSEMAAAVASAARDLSDLYSGNLVGSVRLVDSSAITMNHDEFIEAMQMGFPIR